MSDFVDGLQTVEHLAKAIQSYPNLNPQQILFLQHIARTARRLADLIAPIPDSPLAYGIILPRMADELLEPMAVIYGYARMLIDQPQSFGDTTLPPPAIEHAEVIVSLGRGLAREIENIARDSFQSRLDARQASPISVDLWSFVCDYLPIWQYELRDTRTKIHCHAPSNPLPAVTIRAYHFIEFLRHMIITPAQEIVDPFDWQLSFTLPAQNHLQLCLQNATHPLTDEDLFTLFEKQGRNLFRQQAKRVPMQLFLPQDTQDGTLFIMDFAI